ncbi:hypothetical protein DFA_02317 [Cavenderia fasciculata]|uniref:Transmembrane protein n=1 Tax=Cavenderia fasciculata TaxID=261658 RepID=F4PZ44_CACFS|nr:uncharacterized protein DFA_02317 [Cavenderia fasciculata]EGG19073.1 hypothetical protein DFA_02317 [Cavenderia fasciculata]|eukprot:XP_004366706.1 hypothetical protein DFA_02317 [Cavenderia fasciculata]
MFKSTTLMFTIFVIILCAAVVANAAITSVVQEGKKLTINYSPMTMIWFDNQLINDGVTYDVKPYCKAMYGWSPLVCNLLSVPDCDSIRLYGSAGIGATNLQMLYTFNCTVIA